MSNAMPGGETSEPANARSFRWRLIPAAVLFFYGGLAALGGVVMLAGAIFVNLRYGWIVSHPDTPTLNQAALTTAHLTEWFMGSLVGVVAIFSGLACLRGRWYVTWGTVALFFLLMGVHAAIFKTP